MTNVVEKKKGLMSGVVVSQAMNKTIIVAVETFKEHPKYHKRYTSTKKYKVHDEENVHTVGEKVQFEMCRPMSKGKSYRVI